MSSVLPLNVFLPSSQLCLPLHLPTHVVHLFFLSTISHLSSSSPCSPASTSWLLLAPPSSASSSLVHPSLSLSNERGIFERKRVREKERQQKEEVEVEGWVPIRAAASSLHVARNTTLRQKKGIIRWQTAFTQGTSYWQPQNR